MSRTRSSRVIPTDQFLAILNSNGATALNPFATIADVVAAAFTIPVATNYAALPLPATAVNKYYNVINSQGTAWLPGSLGGTYYAKGIYYSDGLTWEYVGEFPFQADQATVDGDTNNTEYVTALTLANYYKWATKLDLSVFQEQNQTTKEPTGFPNRTDSTFSFNDGTRTFTIQPTGVSFDIWTQGTKHEISTPQSIILPNVTGKYFIYFDNSPTLGQTVTFDDSILNDKVLTSVIYYNATTGKGEFAYDERHGLTMDWATHFHLHNAFGTRYYGGFGLSYIIGDGSLDSHGQIALGAGTIADEDIPTTIVDAAIPSNFFEQVLSPIALVPCVYKLGALEWQKDVATSYPYKLVTGVPQYNLDTLGVHTLEDVTDGNYFVVWIFAMPEIETPVISVLGTREDADLNDAKNNNNFGTIDWGDLPSQEYKALYRLIFKYDTTFANTDKVALVEVDDLRGAIDAVLNSSTLSPVSDHGNLIGLGDDDHTQYHNDTRGDARYSQLGHTHVSADITDLVVAPKIKSGVIAGGSFAGNPKKYTLIFGTAFADANYSVSIISVNSRSWTVDAGQTAAQVVLNANANANIAGNVYWTAVKHGEN